MSESLCLVFVSLSLTRWSFPRAIGLASFLNPCGTLTITAREDTNLRTMGAPATHVRVFTSGRDVQKEHAHDAQKEDVHAEMRRRRTRTPSFGAMRRRRTRTPSSSTECTTRSRSYTLTSHLCDFRDGRGRGMARGGKVNSTCCSANKNAELVPDIAGVRMYVRITRKVRVDNEILVMYQPDRGFFGGVQGRCRCLCEKRIPECCV